MGKEDRPFFPKNNRIKLSKLFKINKKSFGGVKMKFLNGVMIGSLITAGAMMIYSESVDNGKKKMVKKGKQFARKIGLS